MGIMPTPEDYNENDAFDELDRKYTFPGTDIQWEVTGCDGQVVYLNSVSQSTHVELSIEEFTMLRRADLMTPI